MENGCGVRRIKQFGITCSWKIVRFWVASVTLLPSHRATMSLIILLQQHFLSGLYFPDYCISVSYIWASTASHFTEFGSLDFYLLDGVLYCICFFNLV